MSNERKTQIPQHALDAFQKSSRNFFENNRKLIESYEASRKAYESEDELYFKQQKLEVNSWRVATSLQCNSK